MRALTRSPAGRKSFSKRGVRLIVATCLGALLAVPLTTGSSVVGALTAAASSPPTTMVTLSKASYYDKTLAGIVGEIGGFLSGYEFSAPNNQPFPDSWFDPANGPYAGNFSHFTPSGSTADYTRYISPGRVRGQDNYFMDFFNQRILQEKGPQPSDTDIRSEYLKYGISDYGGSGVANNLIGSTGMLPFQSGKHEFNSIAWCCEPYIETDTLGFDAPGMPATASRLATKFAAVSGEFDTTTWSQFMAVLMSEAYVTTDARIALTNAAATLPADSWPRHVYQTAVALHNQNPTDWRAAQAALMNDRRYLYGADDDRVLADINQGTMMLAILYGNNDYLQTLQIASIGGNEGVDNATPIGGLMGIIKGMAGTPQAFLDKIYVNGSGVFVNDNSGALVTYVKTNYPAEQKLTDLAKLYQANFEQLLTLNGGTVTTTDYQIPAEPLFTPATIAVTNAGFETGTLSGWVASPSSNAMAETQVGTNSPINHYTLSHSGNWKGTVYTNASSNDVSLSQSITGLTAGATYSARAYVASQSGANAAFVVTNGTATRQTGASSTEDMGTANTTTLGRMWAQRDVEFIAAASTVTVGLRLRSVAGVGSWANIDDVTLQQITSPTATAVEAESAVLTGGSSIQATASASGGRYVTGLGIVGASAQFAVQAPADGEYRFAVSYASASPPEDFAVNGSTSWHLPAHLALTVNTIAIGNVFFPKTGVAGQFAAGQIYIPVSLHAGSNTVTLSRKDGAGSIDLDVAQISAFPTAITNVVAGAAPIAVAVTNSSFEDNGSATQTPTGWDTWPGAAGTDADADFVESGGHSSTYRLTQYKATAYEVYTSQTLHNLADGVYSVSAWVVGGGGQTSAYMDVKNYGGGAARQISIPQSGYPNWTLITIGNVSVTGGSLTLGFYSNAHAGNWLSADQIQVSVQ